MLISNSILAAVFFSEAIFQEVSRQTIINCARQFVALADVGNSTLGSIHLYSQFPSYCPSPSLNYSSGSTNYTDATNATYNVPIISNIIDAVNQVKTGLATTNAIIPLSVIYLSGFLAYLSVMVYCNFKSYADFAFEDYRDFGASIVKRVFFAH
jgi:hypothetical protein